MNNKISTVVNRIFDIAWIIFLVVQFVCLTAWYAVTVSDLKVTVYKGAFGVSCVLCVVVIILNLVRKLYPVKTLICFILLGAVFAASWYFSKNNMLIWSFMIIAAAYEQDSRRIIKISAILTLASLILTYLSCKVGLNIDYLFDPDTRHRMGLGYNWTTVAPTLFFFFVLEYIFLRRELMKIWEYLILEIVNVVLFIVTDTNLPFILLTLVIIFFVIEGFFKDHWKVFKKGNWLYYIMPVLVCAVTLAVYFLFNPESSLWMKISSVLNNRLELGKMAVDNYGITLFGQNITWIGNTINGSTGTYNYVDCSYMMILLNYGAVFLAGVIALYTRMMHRAIKSSNYWLVFIVIAILIHSFTEPRLMDMAFNIIPVLAVAKLENKPLRYIGK